MKKYSSFLGVFIFLSITALADARYDQVENVIQFSKDSTRATDACNTFILGIQNLDNSSHEYYLKKEIALQVLLKAKGYPGTPASTENALNSLLFIDDDDLPGGTLAGELRAAVTNLSDCRSVDYYGILNRLIASRKRFHFSDQQDSELRTLVFNYLLNESSGPRFLYQVRMMTRLLSLSVKQMLFFPTPDQRLKLEKIETIQAQSESEEGKHLSELEAGESKTASKDNINELQVNHAALVQILWQINESQKLRLPLAELLYEIKKNE